MKASPLPDRLLRVVRRGLTESATSEDRHLAAEALHVVADFARRASSPPATAPTPSEGARLLYEDLLARKEKWFAEAAEIDLSRFETRTDNAELVDLLNDLRHFLPGAAHWIVNVAAKRLGAAPLSPSGTTDAERLDWLEDRGVQFISFADTRSLSPHSMTLRAAIDAARGVNVSSGRADAVVPGADNA